MSIYIGNLPYQVTEEDLQEVFAEYGNVKRVYIPTDKQSGRVKGFGFVEMDSDDHEDSAIAALDGAEWLGRQLRVNKAKPRENEPKRKGRKKDW